MIYYIETGDKIIKLRGTNFYSVKLIAYASDMNDWQISCGAVKKESLAVFSYRMAKSGNEKTDGEILSIEFVPPNFTFTN